MTRPYSMCSEEECRERQTCMEISEWEATVETFSKTPKFRVMDPCLAVSKYRRSAAGTKQRTPRRLNQLLKSWKHLCHLVVHQNIHPTQPKRSFAATVSFVDDRVRAIQVDLVVSQQVSRKIQLQLVRYQIVSLYLLSNLSSKSRVVFEPKFARQALMTALVTYWNDDTAASSVDADDEILCYTTLCHVAANVVSSSGSWVEGDEILAAYRQHSTAASSGKKYPKFSLALRIAAAIHSEQYHMALKLLSDDQSSAFGQLCRICMAPCLNRLRWSSLSHYNKAFMKREKLEPLEVARLLYLPHEEAAVAFCISAGMLVEEDFILFKAGPMQELESYAVDRTVDDWFCFGDHVKGRVDENHVTIPSCELLERLILQGDEK